MIKIETYMDIKKKKFTKFSPEVVKLWEKTTKVFEILSTKDPHVKPCFSPKDS